MDKTADSTNRASGPQLKREQAAMLSHYELMHGLALISNLRLRKYLGLIEAQRAKKTVEEDPLETLRKAMRQRNNFSVISGSVVGQDPPLLALGCRKQWPVSRSL